MLLSYVCESVRASDGRRPEDPGRQTRSPDLKPPRGATPDLSQGKCVLIGPPPHTPSEILGGTPRQESPPPPAAYREASPASCVRNPGLHGAGSSPCLSGPCVSFQPAPDCRPSQVHPQKGVSRPHSGLRTAGPRLLPVPVSWSLQGG